jgi:capsular exopolysaccharide synthesis family protein
MTQPTSMKLVDDADPHGGDFWADVPGGGLEKPRVAAGGGSRKPADPLEQVKRLVRGRIPALIVACSAGAFLGGFLGWNSSEPEWRAQGTVFVSPNLPSLLATRDSSLGDYKGFMRQAAFSIKEKPTIAERAIETPAWQEVKTKLSPNGFRSKVEASFPDTGYNLRIHFTHDDPRVAEAGARATIMAFEEQFYDERNLVSQTVIENKRRVLADERERLVELTNEVDAIARGYDGDRDLGGYTERLRERVDGGRRTLEQLKLDRDRALRLKAEAAKLRPEQLSVADERLREFLRRRDSLQSDIARFSRFYGERSRAVRELQVELDSLNDQIEQRAEQVREFFYGTMPSLADGLQENVAVTDLYIEGLEARIDRLTQVVFDLDENLKVATNDRSDLERNKIEQKRSRNVIEMLEEDVKKEIEQGILEANLGSDGRGWVIPTLPQEGAAFAVNDKRFETALGGTIIGAGFPAGLILLLGLLDKRIRYSDDAGDLANEISGINGQTVPVLGVLPDLPNRLSDPNQASIAAHCVHQIRTILQIHHAVPLAGGDDAGEEPRAFALTSAARDDGKTSLALALGLSYAGSGCRTLLIDTDLRTGGLSKRLEVEGDEGVLDAIVGDDLLGATCETEVPNLAVLPIGNAKGGKAGVFSPAAVRQMLRHAKRHFDVILLDCGPILGSIEATPVASAADASIMVVCRNQDKTLVRRAVKHLEAANAHVAGLVYNKAAPADFERSVAGMNYRDTAPVVKSKPASKSLASRPTKGRAA